MEEVKVSIYKIESCGYYPRKGDNPNFGQLGEILRDLKQWGSSKRLAHTKTFDPRESSHTLPVYLVDATQADDAWLLTLWNEAHNTDGTIASINGQASVGNAEVTETEVEEGHIPGHASYFWFLPDLGVMASVRFQHPTTSVDPMNKYLQSFIRSFSSFVVLGDEDESGQRPVVGYRANENSELNRLSPRFKTKVFVKKGPVDYIASHAQSIRKLKRKAKLRLAIQTDKGVFQWLLRGMNLVEHHTAQQEAKVQYEVEVDGLSEDEVREIVDQWYGDDNDDSDFGFALRGDTKEYWLGRAYARDTLSFELVRNNAELVQPRSLLSELARYKQHILGLMD